MKKLLKVSLGVLLVSHFFGLSSASAEGLVSEAAEDTENLITTALDPNDAELNPSWAPKWKELVGLWHLEDSSHSHKAADSSSGQDNTGNLKGGVTLGASGHLKTAGSFDGNSGFIETPLLSTATSKITMMAWFKSNDYAQAGQMIFFNGSEEGANGYGVALNMENQTSGELRILYGGVLWYDTGAFITDNNWHHFALAIRADGHPDLYLDGALVFSGYASSPNAPTRYANIGRNDYSVDHPTYPRFFNGTIDEVAFWTTDLTTAEIQTIYHRQK